MTSISSYTFLSVRPSSLLLASKGFAASDLFYLRLSGLSKVPHCFGQALLLLLPLSSLSMTGMFCSILILFMFHFTASQVPTGQFDFLSYFVIYTSPVHSRFCFLPLSGARFKSPIAAHMFCIITSLRVGVARFYFSSLPDRLTSHVASVPSPSRLFGGFGVFLRGLPALQYFFVAFSQKVIKTSWFAHAAASCVFPHLALRCKSQQFALLLLLLLLRLSQLASFSI